MRIYLDNCCFNRPFDDQSQLRVREEAEAKLRVQDWIRAGTLDLVWSFMLDIENAVNPVEARRKAIADWKRLARIDVGLDSEIEHNARFLENLGFKSLDALHLACSQAAGSVYFLTTDDGVLRRRGVWRGVLIVSPIEFILEVNS